MPFVVDGLISGTSTLIFGEAKAGKSFFVSALLVALTGGESEFLGRKVSTGRPYRPAVCWTDDDGDGEYSTRMASVLPNDADADVLFYELPIMRTQAHWIALRDRL
ncbi:AAA family ATPase, partial [Micromonospora chalcea]|uniref:AAA family ATPase n=1 Tax=Micromonospora chalcea TaxID=1874 RepID=UPI0021A5109F